jgi:hypothetical protein
MQQHRFPRRCFRLVVAGGLVGTHDLKSYAGGSVATGRVSHTGQVKSEVSDKERHPGPAGWGLGIGLTSQSHKKQTCRENNIIELPAGRMVRNTAWAKS